MIINRGTHGCFSSPSMNVGNLIDYLSRYPRELPVRIGAFEVVEAVDDEGEPIETLEIGEEALTEGHCHLWDLGGEDSFLLIRSDLSFDMSSSEDDELYTDILDQLADLGPSIAERHEADELINRDAYDLLVKIGSPIDGSKAETVAEAYALFPAYTPDADELLALKLVSLVVDKFLGLTPAGMDAIDRIGKKNRWPIPDEIELARWL